MAIRSFTVAPRILTAGRLRSTDAPITHTIIRRRSSAGANRIVPTDARRYVAPPWMTTPASLVG